MLTPNLDRRERDREVQITPRKIRLPARTLRGPAPRAPRIGRLSVPRRALSVPGRTLQVRPRPLWRRVRASNRRGGSRRPGPAEREARTRKQGPRGAPGRVSACSCELGGTCLNPCRSSARGGDRGSGRRTWSGIWPSEGSFRGLFAGSKSWDRQPARVSSWRVSRRGAPSASPLPRRGSEPRARGSPRGGLRAILARRGGRARWRTGARARPRSGVRPARGRAPRGPRPARTAAGGPAGRRAASPVRR